MNKICLILILMLTMQLSLAHKWTETETIITGGMERSFELYVPKSYSEAKDYPVLFVLHGGGGRADRMGRFTGYRFNELAQRDGFIVVYPNGYEKGWNDGARDTIALARRLNIDDVGFFKSMLVELKKNLSIDNNNIFVCGISNGGFMAQRLAFELSDQIKGIAVVAANLSVEQSNKPMPGQKVSVMFICGTHDPLVPYHGGHVTVFKQKRGAVLSMPESIAYWKKMNGCKELEEYQVIPDINKKDRCSAQKKVWVYQGNENIKVVNITVKNGGHTWPGTRQYLPVKLVGRTNRDFNACDEMWNFFQSLR